ncbi:hypothetical protein SteCoe_35416 [Stentor coeruleus]|uniref:Uncharacterized protein n=1 Tax=Stentor coeruleus TaxID=5963 RepID=A0A1R2ASD6_9CILI|nr:hypothetical protein SteCoe_35416 [Stentor coeruleus]
MSYEFLCLKEISNPDWSFVNSTIQALFSFQLIRERILEFQCCCDSCLPCSLKSLLFSYIAGLDSQSEVSAEDFLKKFRISISLSEPNCYIFFLDLLKSLESKNINLGFQGQIRVTWTCENNDFFGTFYDFKNSCKLDMKTIIKPFNPQLLLEKSNDNFLTTKNLYHNITEYAKIVMLKKSLNVLKFYLFLIFLPLELYGKMILDH